MPKIFWLTIWLAITIFNWAAAASSNPSAQYEVAFVGGLNDSALKTCEAKIVPLCPSFRANPFKHNACMQKQMQGKTFCTQNLVFLNDTDGFVQTLKRYTVVDVVYAVIAAADRMDDYFMVGHAGELVSINVDDINLSAPGATELNKKYPKRINSTGRVLNFPTVTPLPNGGERVLFMQELSDTCLACAVIGIAEVAYDFDQKGKFIGVTVLKIDTGKTAKRLETQSYKYWAKYHASHKNDSLRE